MQKITLMAVGSMKATWIKGGCTEYADRLSRAFDFSLVEIPASKQKDPTKQQEEESDAILNRLEKIGGNVWVLDEKGKELTSESFADEISTFADRGESVTFIIGGAYGLTDSFKQEADQLFALSKMTLAHGFARLLFLEQLYRASEIMKGSGYHH